MFIENFLAQLRRNGVVDRRAAALFDEVNLPDQQYSALKKTHDYLEIDSKISTVMLTNKTLDAAKTGRCIQVLQREPSLTDLRSLCNGILFDEIQPPRPKDHDAIVDGLCHRYGAVGREERAREHERERKSDIISSFQKSTPRVVCGSALIH